MSFQEFQMQWRQKKNTLLAVRLCKQIHKKGLELPEKIFAGKVAFVGSFTLDDICDTFKISSLFDIEVDAKTFVGEYNQYAQELLNPESALFQFGPEMTFLLLNGHTVLGEAYDAGTETSQEMREIVDSCCTLFEQLSRTFQQQGCGLLVIHTIPEPCWDSWGIQAGSPGSVTWACRCINNRLRELASEYSSIMVLESSLIETRLGRDSAHDEKMRHIGKFCYSQAGTLAIVSEQMRYWRALKGKTRKCIVLDLDDTLWGGIVGEDGIEGIALSSHGAGSPYQEFQRTLLGYYRRGIILAVNSRNNWDDAMEVIASHPEQILREKFFGAICINWSDKASNLMTIAKELNIGLDTLVFFDDDKHNRELVRQQLPQVLVPDFPDDPSLLSQTLLSIAEFDTLSFTAEDRKRGHMYATERSRRDAQKTSAGDINDFLATLETKVSIQPADSFNIPRIAQLTQRTNQFNMTTCRYSPAEIEQMANDPGKHVFAMAVKDKFGDSGIVGAAIVNIKDKTWVLETFLMSCRVLGRRIEEGFLWWIANQAKIVRANAILGEVIFTPKNIPARQLFSKMDFEVLEKTNAGIKWIGKVERILLKCPDTLEFIKQHQK